MKILFVNACARKNSRTMELCRHYLDSMIQSKNCTDVEIKSADLYDLDLLPLNEKRLAEREADVENRSFTSSIYDAVRDFAEADRIVIGAPYWDLSFPAQLKVYFENVCVNHLTFYYNEQGIPQSLCRADKVVYITTAGGYIGDHDHGSAYVKDLCSSLFGIKSFDRISAEGLDIQGNDAAAILSEARSQIDEILKAEMEVFL